MMVTPPIAAKPRVALFIDAENISHTLASQIVTHASALGNLIIRNCYAKADKLKDWESAIKAHHMVPMQTPQHLKENASDFALTIDAVALLHGDRFDHAVIASSDADFSLLAIHLRQHGKAITGVGENKTDQSFRNSFDDFKTVPEPPEAIVSDTELLRIFRTVSKDGITAHAGQLGQALLNEYPHYKKGYGSTGAFLEARGLFTREGQIVTLTPIRHDGSANCLNPKRDSCFRRNDERERPTVN
ncbi:NYN domain-containing protein [Aestuariivirga sp.]|uniref:NYN domain-containing protein n=1 Tax=Aestuariivirga sp. TaxID=2650926 RepID=UPI0039E4C73A